MPLASYDPDRSLVLWVQFNRSARSNENFNSWCAEIVSCMRTKLSSDHLSKNTHWRPILPTPGPLYASMIWGRLLVTCGDGLGIFKVPFLLSGKKIHRTRKVGL